MTTIDKPEHTYTSERTVKNAIKKVLTANGWFWWMPPANGYGRAGIADMHALRDGVFLAIETKFGKNKPTPMQEDFLASVLQSGGHAVVVNEKNIPQFEQWLQLHARTTMPRTTTPLDDLDSALQLQLAAALLPKT